MPSIAIYPPSKRRDYLMLVAAVAASDEELHPDELELLNRWMKEFELPSRYKRAVLAAAYDEPPNIDKIQRRLSKTDLVYSLMLDMMGMAMADGVLMDDERILLRDVADTLEFDPIDFNILIEFVHSAHHASFLSNPEPLYEHNIESAFELLKHRRVRLFAHTLLCVVSPEFDRVLKERWFASQTD
ncbi:MAG: TerB family tellurite resistance protein [SAR324 cluster bacterium]|nr:TerB family tellurite resistance protein [SAR324 cluster bacterium]